MDLFLLLLFFWLAEASRPSVLMKFIHNTSVKLTELTWNSANKRQIFFIPSGRNKSKPNKCGSFLVERKY